ncbi:MAG: DUF4167 domain-containing protein [Pseudomonadota bacterium]
MRQGQNNRRSRGRSNNRRSNTPNRNQTFDSNGPDTRIRGNASQVLEKYQALARDAMSSGDPIMAENYLQHAEHYQRVINQMNEAIVQAQLQAEQAREQRAAASPPQQPTQQPNGRAHPAHDGSGERRAGNGAGFDGQPADPREQPVADFGHDPREEPQPAPKQAPAPDAEAAPPEAAAEASAEPEAEPEEKPRRRRGRPRRSVAAEEGSETTPASAE